MSIVSVSDGGHSYWSGWIRKRQIQHLRGVDAVNDITSPHCNVTRSRRLQRDSITHTPFSSCHKQFSNIIGKILSNSFIQLVQFKLHERSYYTQLVVFIYWLRCCVHQSSLFLWWTKHRLTTLQTTLLLLLLLLILTCDGQTSRHG